MFVVVCANKRFNLTAQKLSIGPVANFLAGRVPRRKNFAGCFGQCDFHRVKQGVSDVTTYSQRKGNLKIPVEILPRCANSYKVKKGLA